jgi:plastocyanin
MKKSTLIWIVVAAIVIIVAARFDVSSDSKASETGSATPTDSTMNGMGSMSGSSGSSHVQTPAPAPKGASSASLPATDVLPSKSVTIEIIDFGFSPKNVSVKKGTTVTWVNHDSASHTVTAAPGGPSSATLKPGQSYSFTFTIAGTVNYHCSIHPGMTGTVVVAE